MLKNYEVKFVLVVEEVKLILSEVCGEVENVKE